MDTNVFVYAVPIIYTEDFQDGRDVEGVQFVNPFLAGASLPPE